jgi:hypothetical protein
MATTALSSRKNTVADLDFSDDQVTVPVDSGARNRTFASSTSFLLALAMRTTKLCPREFGLAIPGAAGIQITIVENGEGDIDFRLDLADDQFGARVARIGSATGARPGGERIVAIAPAASEADPDSATTHEDMPVTIDVLGGDTDANCDPGNVGWRFQPERCGVLPAK